MYCKVHHENLEIWGWWHLQRAGRLQLADVQTARGILRRDRPDRGPFETKYDDRILELIRAFLERHARCEVREISEVDKGYEREIGEAPTGWKTFLVHDDRSLQEYSRLAHNEDLQRYVAKWTPLVEDAKRQLESGKGLPWKRRRLAVWIPDMERRLREANDEIAGIPHPAQSSEGSGPGMQPSWRSFGHLEDLLERMQKEPLGG